MGFYDLPIPNNGTTHTITNPLGLGQVANYTKNPILDVGYQCKDARPYFAFINSSTTYYIRIHPDNLVLNDDVSMYSASSITKYGVTYTKMTRLSGNGTVTAIGSSATISYNNRTYTYTAANNVDVFLNKLNPWSFYKPYELNNEYGETRCSDLTNNTTNWDTEIKGSVIKYGFDLSGDTESTSTINTNVVCFSTTQLFNKAAYTEGHWKYIRPSTVFRLTDFIGYNKNAKCQFGRDLTGIIEGNNCKIYEPGADVYYYNMIYDSSLNRNIEIDLLASTLDDGINFRSVGSPWYFGVLRTKIGSPGTLDFIGPIDSNNTILPPQPVNTVFPANGSANESARVRISFPSEGNYQCCFVFADDDNIQDATKWVYLPNGYFTVNYSSKNLPLYITMYGATFSDSHNSQTYNYPYYIYFDENYPRRDVNSVSISKGSYICTVRFFFNVTNNDPTNARSATIHIPWYIEGTSSPSDYVDKTITIPAGVQNVHFYIDVPVSDAGDHDVYLGGGASAQQAEKGLAFQITYTVASTVAGTQYLNYASTTSTQDTDISNNKTDIHYLYDALVNWQHYFVDTSKSYIWDQNRMYIDNIITLSDNTIISI